MAQQGCQAANRLDYAVGLATRRVGNCLDRPQRQAQGRYQVCRTQTFNPAQFKRRTVDNVGAAAEAIVFVIQPGPVITACLRQRYRNGYLGDGGFHLFSVTDARHKEIYCRPQQQQHYHRFSPHASTHYAAILLRLLVLCPVRRAPRHARLHHTP